MNVQHTEYQQILQTTVTTTTTTTTTTTRYIHSFIHSFIYFSFRQSIQGHRQPTVYRTCHTVNAI